MKYSFFLMKYSFLDGIYFLDKKSNGRTEIVKTQKVKNVNIKNKGSKQQWQKHEKLRTKSII